jgi:hypothetical protein
VGETETSHDAKLKAGDNFRERMRRRRKVGGRKVQPEGYSEVSASENKPIAIDSLRASYGLSHWRFLTATNCKIEIAGG